MAKPRLPERFSLMNRDYRVRLASDKEQRTMIEGDDPAYGIIDYENAEIVLRRQKNRDHFEHTYFHEFAHALYMAIGRPDLAEDEKLVDATGAALHQYEKTMTSRVAMRERKNDQRSQPRNRNSGTRSRVR